MRFRKSLFVYSIKNKLSTSGKAEIMENALIYCRVSTEEQAKNNDSINTQERTCRKFAESNSYKITGVYKDEGRSATTLDRPALQDLLVRCQQDKSVSIALVTETDRLARNTNNHLTIKALLKKAGVKLISIAQPMLDESPEGKMIDTIVASVNQFQSEITGRKSARGMQNKFDTGVYPGWAPLGYKNVRINENGVIQNLHKGDLSGEEYLAKKSKTKGVIIKDPEKFELVKELLKMYLTGDYSGLELCDIFYAKGLRSKMGTRLSNSVLLVLLKDPFYCGLIHWKGQERMGKHEAMISVDEHHQILNIISAHNQHASRRRIHNFLLRGFLFCDICNGRCVGDKHRQYTHYHCSQKIQKHGNKGQNVATLEIEEQVEELFKTIKFSKTFINLIIHKVKRFYEKQRKEKNHKIRILLNKKMRAEKDRVIAEKKLIAGVFDDEDFGRVKARSKQEEATFDNQIDELKEENEIDFETIRQILILAKDIYGAYKKAPYELKRLYLSLFWDGFWIKDQIIVKKEPSNLIKTLQSEHKILLTPYWCPRRESDPHELSLKGF